MFEIKSLLKIFRFVVDYFIRRFHRGEFVVDRPFVLDAYGPVANPFGKTRQILSRSLIRVAAIVTVAQFGEEFRQEVDGSDIDDRATLSSLSSLLLKSVTISYFHYKQIREHRRTRSRWRIKETNVRRIVVFHIASLCVSNV